MPFGQNKGFVSFEAQLENVISKLVADDYEKI
jgi:hypothetical protein